MKHIELLWTLREEQEPPLGSLLLIRGYNGFTELAYMEIDGLHKPWGYDDYDTTTLTLDRVKWWMALSNPDGV